MPKCSCHQRPCAVLLEQPAGRRRPAADPGRPIGVPAVPLLRPRRAALPVRFGGRRLSARLLPPLPTKRRRGLVSELLITAWSGDVWVSIGEALLFGAVSLVFGTWVSRTVGLLGADAPAGETLAVGLASGLMVLAAWWAAIWSGGRSSFTPVAVGFGVAIALALARRARRRAATDDPASAAVDPGGEAIPTRSPLRRSAGPQRPGRCRVHRRGGTALWLDHGAEPPRRRAARRADRPGLLRGPRRGPRRHGHRDQHPPLRVLRPARCPGADLVSLG